MPDETLVREYLDGNEEALKLLIERYLPRLTAYAARFTPENAEDVAQESLFKAWKALSCFDGSLAFQPWVFKITKNTALDWLKRSKQTTVVDLEDLELEDDAPIPSHKAADAEVARRIAEIIEGLAEPYRSVILMHYQEGLSLKEISARSKKPLNTVRSQHQRALRIVKPFCADLAWGP